mgnify:CR=1 FL=1
MLLDLKPAAIVATASGEEAVHTCTVLVLILS